MGGVPETKLGRTDTEYNVKQSRPPEGKLYKYANIICNNKSNRDSTSITRGQRWPIETALMRGGMLHGIVLTLLQP